MLLISTSIFIILQLSTCPNRPELLHKSVNLSARPLLMSFKMPCAIFIQVTLLDCIIISSLDHEGQFTYWSMRTNARPENKGLRLDYFMCSKTIFPRSVDEGSSSSERQVVVRDCGILHEFGIGCSDHCPITLALQIQGE